MTDRITHLKLKNFKCFQNLDIDLKPLTILTGANSSGKSSIIYSILVALQSKDFPYFLSANGKYVNLGSYKNIVYRHETDRDITIELTIDDLEIRTVWQQNEIKRSFELKFLQVKELIEGNNLLEIEKKKKYFLKFNYSYNFLEKIILKAKQLNREWELKTFEHRFNAALEGFNNYILSKISSRDDTSNNICLPLSFQNLTSLEAKIKSSKNTQLLANYDIVMIFLNSLIENVNFISSFRLYPERTYYEKSQSSYSVSKFGEGYTDQIIDWQSENKEVFADLIKIMKSLDLFHDIQAKRIEGGRFELLVKPKANSVFSSLNDVGFGISQFLPIVTADLQLGDGSTLFVAQPEIHLHPNIQAKFANYVTQQIYEKENNYVVETHSEYFLNRVRLLLVEGTLKAEDVAIYYLENDGQDVTVHQLEFTTKGEILNAPEGFFDTYMMDVMDIAFKA